MKIEIGDRIMIIGSSGRDYSIGDTGRIIKQSNMYNGKWWVEFDNGRKRAVRGLHLFKLDFKIGDKVKVIKKGISYGSEKYFDKSGTILEIKSISYKPYCALNINGIKTTHEIYLDEIKLLEKLDTISKYGSLVHRILSLNDGWNKEADDILNEIIGETGNGRSIISIPCLSRADSGICVEKGNWNLINKDSPYFPYKTQCEKNSAFQKALLWILDHANIKEDMVGTTKKIKIEDKVYEAKIVREI